MIEFFVRKEPPTNIIEAKDTIQDRRSDPIGHQYYQYSTCIVVLAHATAKTNKLPMLKSTKLYLHVKRLIIR